MAAVLREVQEAWSSVRGTSSKITANTAAPYFPQEERPKKTVLCRCVYLGSYLVMAKVRMDASFKMIVQRANGKTDGKLTKEP